MCLSDIDIAHTAHPAPAVSRAPKVYAHTHTAAGALSLKFSAVSEGGMGMLSSLNQEHRSNYLRFFKKLNVLSSSKHLHKSDLH